MLGSQSAISGYIIIMASPNIITRTKGVIDLYMSPRLISGGAIALIRNKLYPKGGVM